jgi:tRNA modification GTPase
MAGGRGEPRRARLVSLQTEDGSVLDQGLVLWFPGPSSFTGEDVAELHLHGSIAVEQALANALIAQGLRPATAGEFTLRAFEAGKLDLAQAEGLSDLLEAETEAQRRQALGQLGGRLSEVAEGWRARLIRIAATLEAAIDFPDEEDVPAMIADSAVPQMRELAADMRAALAGAGAAQAVRRGVTVVITGPPNAGKSSLLNRLAGEERAIVSRHAGTTRDVVEVVTEIAGQRVTLIDTAGIRESHDEVEREGIERARRAAATADIVIAMEEAGSGGAVPERADMAVANKTDLAGAPEGWLPLSLVTGEGWREVEERLASLVSARTAGGPLTRQRHADLVRGASKLLEKASVEERPAEVLGEDVRAATRMVEEIVGRVDVEHLLDEIFASFCIGK